MMEQLRQFAAWTKLAGTAGEAESFAWLKAQLESLGLPATLLSHDAYISLPGAAHLTCDGARINAITQSMSRPSQPEGSSGVLVDLGDGSESAFAAQDVTGRIVLVDGIASPVIAARATRAGAKGIVHVSPHALLHEMCISPVWGSPSLITRAALPDVVVLTVTAEDGAALRQRLAERQTQVTLHAAVDAGWRKTPLLVADMPPPAGANAPFVLLSCHVDTWFHGVMDNGSANIAMLEVVRLCAQLRDQWRRGLRLCFWSGHSQGRYSGSTWYADNHWLELDERCVAHVNLDSPGAVGATNLTQTGSAGALFGIAAAAIAAETGQVLAGKRKARSADDSFPGIGIPSVFGSLSTQEPGALKLRNELGWWWHTEHDLIDKIEPANLARDVRIVLRVVWDLLGRERLPLDFAPQITGLREELCAISERLKDRFDLLAASEAIRQLDQRLKRLSQDPPNGNAEAFNRAILKLSRLLVPLDYTTGNRFAHDPATPLMAWPVIEPIRRLAKTKTGDADEPFAKVDAVRARNRLVHDLREASALVDELYDGVRR
ncbi:M28 family peptidase [Bradyrhizobium sp. C-145]|uniref:M28 family peptidase n=1 Tax=Bradyrhizobium sp. C-145 TaxID=574727 RepID=UPI00201B8198|nr:M28 family peptidase [Bradyrhizobium sp. C-145]UQR66673.1 M28 family peptidase [Bradyrhizobium sp. C-145]